MSTLVVEKDPLGSNDLTITTDYEYDSLGRLYNQTEKPENPDANSDPSWQQTVYAYDALGSRTKETKPNGIVTTYSYDALSRLKEKIADYGDSPHINQKTEWGYDRLGRQTSITGYADGSTAQTTTYTYDGLDRITNVSYPDGNDIDFTYNAAGKVVRRNDQRGIVTTYDYDNNYNMLQKLVDGNSITDDANETFSYDGLARMLTADKKVDSNTVSETTFVYNDIGKVTDTNETYFAGSTKTIQYTYDQAGYLNKTGYPYSTIYTYTTRDWQGRIVSMKYLINEMVRYKYIGSRVAQRTYLPPNPDIVYQPSYDNLGRITSADSGTSYAKFDYQYDPNTSNIGKMTYVHRPDDPCSDFSYDDLDRLTVAEYGIQDNNEAFTMDDLGNRTTVNVRAGSDVNYVVDNLTNRYNTVGDANLSYDSAGNLTTDKDGYEYQYDYENRIVKITKDGNDIAEFAYDGLGRRIRKIDSDANETTHYFYNNNWQVLCEYDGSGTFKAWYAYGNYIDEVLMRGTSIAPPFTKFYVHDHLYSPAALAAWAGTVVERYEYDAYGNPYILEPNFAADPDGKSDYGNPYYFQGKSLDLLDGGGLEFMSWPYRDYSTYLGGWLQAEKLGMIPNHDGINPFSPETQYKDSLNSYEFVRSNPVVKRDSHGLEEWAPEPVPDPAEPPPPGFHTPPSLRRGGTTFGGCWECCGNTLQAIDMANRAFSAGGSCTQWFADHFSHGETYRVNIKGRFAPFPGGTWPFSNEMYIAQWACGDEPSYIATVLVHETAHHYCPLIIFGGKGCAERAAEACQDELANLP